MNFGLRIIGDTVRVVIHHLIPDNYSDKHPDNNGTNYAIGGALITMFGMFTGVVLSNLRAIDLSSTRNLAIVGTSLFVGLMVPYWVENFPEEVATGNFIRVVEILAYL